MTRGWPTIRAPWTDEQVEALRQHQADEQVHPYTCACGGHTALVPTRDGWVCPGCGYTQAWAHEPFGLQQLTRPATGGEGREG